jgi:hypothetical protein
MAEYLTAEMIEEHSLTAPLVWIEHYPEHHGKLGEYSLVSFSSREPKDVCLGEVWRSRIGYPRWESLCSEEVELLVGRLGEQDMTPLTRRKPF